MRSIRELIDEIDTLHNIMFIFSFDTKLTEDENAGLNPIKRYGCVYKMKLRANDSTASTTWQISIKLPSQRI